MWQYNYATELYHHGIKGQKWGVRRFQKNGRLTNAGKKRYNSTDLEEEQKTKSRIKKAAIIGASIATMALAVYGGYKISNSRMFDRTIKAGKDFYRQGHKNESNGLNELIYTTFKKSDQKKYANNSVLKDKIAYKIRNKSNVKIAGTKSAERIFNDLVKNNKDFASHYGHMSYKDFNGSLGVANKMIIENKISLKDTYMSPYFRALASKGYQGFVDTQDQFAKIPVVLINTNKQFSIHR